MEGADETSAYVNTGMEQQGYPQLTPQITAVNNK